MATNQTAVIGDIKHQTNPESREVIRITVLNPDLSQSDLKMSTDIFVSSKDITHDALKGLMVDAANELASAYLQRGEFRYGKEGFEWDNTQSLPDASTLMKPLVFTHIIESVQGLTDIKAEFRSLSLPIETNTGLVTNFYLMMQWASSTATQTLSKYHRYY